MSALYHAQLYRCPRTAGRDGGSHSLHHCRRTASLPTHTCITADALPEMAVVQMWLNKTFVVYMRELSSVIDHKMHRIAKKHEGGSIQTDFGRDRLIIDGQLVEATQEDDCGALLACFATT